MNVSCRFYLTLSLLPFSLSSFDCRPFRRLSSRCSGCLWLSIAGGREEQPDRGRGTPEGNDHVLAEGAGGPQEGDHGGQEDQGEGGEGAPHGQEIARPDGERVALRGTGHVTVWPQDLGFGVVSLYGLKRRS